MMRVIKQKNMIYGLLLMSLTACSSYQPYKMAFEQPIKATTCKIGSPLPYQKLTVRGLPLVSLCGQETTNAKLIFEQAGFEVSDLREFLISENNVFSDAEPIFVRYELAEKRKENNQPRVRLSFDAVVAWDAVLNYRLIGLVDAKTPLMGSDALEAIKILTGRKADELNTWRSNSMQFLSGLGASFLSNDYESKDVENHAKYLLSLFTDRPWGATPITYQKFSPEACIAARFLVRSGYSDPIKDSIDNIVLSVFSENESKDAVSLRIALENPETRCDSAVTEQINAGLTFKEQRERIKLDEEKRLAEQQLAISKIKERELERQHLAELESYRIQAENFALNNRPFTALALLGWVAANDKKDIPISMPPTRDIALKQGLNINDLLEAIRGEVARQYWATLEYTDGSYTETKTWPSSDIKQPLSRVVRATLNVNYQPMTIEKGTRRTSWVTEGDVIVDKQALAKNQAQQNTIVDAATPYMTRLSAIDQRLANIEQRLQDPKLEIKAGAKQSEVRRMEQICEPVPNAPPKCVNKWTSFSTNAPMTSNGGLSPFEEPKLKEERAKLNQEREKIVAKLSTMGEQVDALKSDVKSTPNKRMQNIHLKDTDTFSYHTKGQVSVKMTIDSKQWDSFSLPLAFDSEAKSYLLNDDAIKTKLRDTAFYQANTEISLRWRAYLAKSLEKMLAKIPDAKAREREQTLANMYLDDSLNDRVFIMHSESVIREEGITVFCWTSKYGCFDFR